MRTGIRYSGPPFELDISEFGIRIFVRKQKLFRALHAFRTPSMLHGM